MRSNTHLPTYRSWQMMKNRCANPNAGDFKYYGGRGITFPPKWSTFDGFVADMGLRPDGTTLDRRKGNESYSKTNCRWVTRQTQSRNREYTRDLTYAGKTMKVWAWAAILDVNPKTIHHRLWMWATGQIAYDRVFAPNPRSKSK